MQIISLIIQIMSIIVFRKSTPIFYKPNNAILPTYKNQKEVLSLSDRTSLFYRL